VSAVAPYPEAREAVVAALRDLDAASNSACTERGAAGKRGGEQPLRTGFAVSPLRTSICGGATCCGVY
jgi:hypothetical protein